MSSSETGFLHFNPPIEHNSERYFRTWELLTEMGLRREVAFCYKGNMQLWGLGFPTKDQAMIFKLRL